MQGKIIKGIGGFYYVHDGIGKVYEFSEIAASSRW